MKGVEFREMRLAHGFSATEVVEWLAREKRVQRTKNFIYALEEQSRVPERWARYLAEQCGEPHATGLWLVVSPGAVIPTRTEARAKRILRERKLEGGFVTPVQWEAPAFLNEAENGSE